LSEWVPEPVAVSYRKIRKQWYEKKVSGGAKNAEHKVPPQPAPQSQKPLTD
jgi:hypothetical protein